MREGSVQTQKSETFLGRFESWKNRERLTDESERNVYETEDTTYKI
jgi:hypothetical protein